MIILHISDTHGRHAELINLPNADIIIHSGDFTMAGTEQEATDFLNWFCDLPYSHKIFIAGNHDDCFYDATISGLDSNCYYLCNSSVVIKGVRFYGVPLFMQDSLSNNQGILYDNIPDDTDVLITHAPPFGILDMADKIHFGSEDLLIKISDISPMLHLFGHIHDSFGIRHQHNTKFSNGSILDMTYNKIRSEFCVIEI